MDEPSLRELQAGFWQAIASAPGEPRAAPSLLRVVAPSARLEPRERLAIYARMYWGRILEVLRDDFARTADAVGEETFVRLARAYLSAHPSRHPSIARVGEAFADFLAGAPGLPPFAADLARLEWARLECFTAPAGEVLRLAELRALPPASFPDLHLTSVPSLAVLELGWSVQRMLEDRGEERLRRERTVLRVWRRGDLVFHATVDAGERTALELLRRGATFAAIAACCRDAGEAAALLARWLEDEIVATPFS